MSTPPTETPAPSRARRNWLGAAGLPGWVPRLLLMVFGTIVGLWAAYHVLGRLRGLLILLAISLFLSIALEPGVNFLARKGWRRGIATGALFLSGLIVVGLFIGLMVPLIVNQTIKLIDKIPSYVDQMAEFAARFGIEFSGERLAEAVSNLGQDLQGIGADVAGSVFGVGTALLSTLLQLLTIGLFTFYMTAEGPKLRRTMLSMLPQVRQREVLRIIDIAIDKTGGYFYSRALLALFAASVAWAAFTIIGVPFALALALWLGVLSQFVPVFGTYLGGVLPLLIALLESPPKAIAVLVYIVVYQQLENYLLAPKITHHTMSLHPAVSFGSAIAGGTLMGIPGALMALPIAATIQAFVSTYIERHEVIRSPLTEDADPPRPETGKPVDG
ncbi:MAG: AI-2E family transporter [Acidimicrobiia bacterium]|nr:AI-2E family transporter [Acidimicrobiia bacterium]